MYMDAHSTRVHRSVRMFCMHCQLLVHFHALYVYAALSVSFPAHPLKTN